MDNDELVAPQLIHRHFLLLISSFSSCVCDSFFNLSLSLAVCVCLGSTVLMTFPLNQQMREREREKLNKYWLMATTYVQPISNKKKKLQTNRTGWPECHLIYAGFFFFQFRVEKLLQSDEIIRLIFMIMMKTLKCIWILLNNVDSILHHYFPLG